MATPIESRVGLLAVVVVYERQIDQVSAWPWLRAALAADEPALSHVLIYDNSPEPRARPGSSGEACSYVHDPANGGTAAAYALAAELATQRGCEWLLLLDHDTVLPGSYLQSLRETMQRAVTATDIGALLPRVRQGRQGAWISPMRVGALGTFKPLHPGQDFRRHEHVSAVASASVLRVAALRSLLPFPAGLWLDYVDHWIFAQLHRSGWRAALIEQVVEHDLSVAGSAAVSARRLHSILRGEARFHALLGPAARAVYPLRVARRLLRLACTRPAMLLRALQPRGDVGRFGP